MIKPFLKWVGGKRCSLPFIQKHYPEHFGLYIEPFLGGGAVLFDVLSRFPEVEAIAVDSNPELINTYRVLRDNPHGLLKDTNALLNKANALNAKSRAEFYYEIRGAFNQIRGNSDHALERAVYLLFLNKTCFNGLYRVNQKGGFNSPVGTYRTLYPYQGLESTSEALKRVSFFHTSFEKVLEWVNEDSFVYFDPPYKPVSKTSNFVGYTSGGFSDNHQRRLAKVVRAVASRGAKVIVSNSDTGDGFFESLYQGFEIERILAGRAINSDKDKRGKVYELLIHN